MTEFKKGDKVKVKGTEFAGTVTDVYWSNQRVDIEPVVGGIQARVVGLPAEWLQLAEPYSWPPQVGDIWVTADEAEFYVVSHGLRVWARPMRAEEGLTYDVGDSKELERFKALEPVLVRRRGVNLWARSRACPTAGNTTWNARRAVTLTLGSAVRILRWVTT